MKSAAGTVLSNGLPTAAGGGRFTFAATPPIPIDSFAVAAGPYASVRWEHRGLSMGWHARRSLTAELERDAADLRRVTEVCFDHYAEIFTEPFPFDSYDQVFVPELNWGALECPGLALDPGLRWAVIRRLAELGGLAEAEIEAERRRDGTATGELGAATALAARPAPEAKAAAWAAMTEDPEVSVRRFRALATGLWSPSQRELVTPYVAAYVAAAPALARRGSAFAAAVGVSFPAMALTAEELELVREKLHEDVPTVLRREWEDELDDRRV